MKKLLLLLMATPLFAQQPAVHDTIPFTLTEYNNIKLQCVVNQDTLSLKFDSGTTGVLLTYDALAKTRGIDTIKRTNTIKMGGQFWDKQRVYPVVLSGQGTDGRFGWDLFAGKVLEIDYDKSLFIVHNTLPKPGRGWEKFAIEYSNTLFCINGNLEINGKKYPNKFLFDTGYQRTIMLDSGWIAQQHYPKDELPVIKKVIMHNGMGEEVPVITVSNEKLNLGKLSLKDIPVQLMTGVNPAWPGIHILGNEVLKRYNTIFDFKENIVYLKPNTLLNAEYTEKG
ncbi:hypothetical protein AM493_15260 [Flavobacterium akiainvivens]|uniref:Aspartyl protease n=1 Tax=Flavobacterium akiainvivens TaxID=1202724 RepID=A0A0M9VJ21_9FLAO|nr:aspartyl protease family protein [Flavobacterium akiainvivens]KOS07242.1 hypothetical protein AM493_15260 [Flavobacterium akiainvivens]SFQ45517.1 gag-polyprotein putative aspartyl protease [Flavobacterium akiainvivens]